MPTTPGQYEFRYFLNHNFRLRAGQPADHGERSVD